MKERQTAAFEQFRSLPPVEPIEIVGLWQGRGIPAGHPLDGVLENLGWFGKRFRADMRADASLFGTRERGLIAIDPARIPLRLALRFHKVGRTGAARILFSYLQRGLQASGPVAFLRIMRFAGAESAAMVYDEQPIAGYFRRFDEGKIMGVMTAKTESTSLNSNGRKSLKKNRRTPNNAPLPVSMILAEQISAACGRPGLAGRSPQGSSALHVLPAFSRPWTPTLSWISWL